MDVEKLQEIQRQLPADVTLVTVSKLHEKAEIDEAYRYGCRIFAENKVQELKQKYDPSYEWHMIGHLQRNKVKDVVPLVSMIQSLDRISLAEEIEKQCAKIEKVMPVLIEVNIAEEDTKSGMAYADVPSFIEVCRQYPHIEVQGLMCIGPHCKDEVRIADCFTQMKTLFTSLQKRYGKDQFRYLSMGMSDDYELAIQCGSTMIRLGSIIMGERNYF